MAKDKLIYASAARKAILDAYPRLAYCIDEIPGVDAVKLVHGRWEMKTVWKGNETQVAVCSACKTYGPVTEVAFQDFPYCPHCGAKMDGDGNV